MTTPLAGVISEGASEYASSASFATFATQFVHIEQVPELIHLLESHPDVWVRWPHAYVLSESASTSERRMLDMDRPGRKSLDIVGAEREVQLMRTLEPPACFWHASYPTDATFFEGIMNRELSEILSVTRVTRLGEFNRDWEPSRPGHQARETKI